MNETDALPIIDLRAPPGETALAIRRACREVGFFYVVGHGVDTELQTRLEALSRDFFARDLEEKLRIRMELGGRAWRGYFPVGAELTSGKPDQKEGLYFGAELDASHPGVVAGTPLHGANLFPALPGFRETVLEYLDAMTRLGHHLMRGIALSLDLEERWFEERLTAEPFVLFRIFNYPALGAAHDALWSVGEHTDYGLLTILRQDATGGLEVRSDDRWITAPPIAGSFVCNLGDMLERMTGGLYRSTPHRVRNTGADARLSFPFFFDPGFDARVESITPGAAVRDSTRWDGASVHEFEGTYGDYLLAKVARVFPGLGREVL